MVTVFNEEILDLFASKLPIILTVNTTESSVGLEVNETAQALTLLLD